MDKKYLIKLKFKRPINIQSPHLTFPTYLTLKPTDIFANLGVETSAQLQECLNKYFYCDRYNKFEKNFGIKTRNFTDLTLNPINLIPDHCLIVDLDLFAFSQDDLDHLTSEHYHPYLHKQKLTKTYVNLYYLQLYQIKQKEKISTPITVIDFYHTYLKKSIAETNQSTNDSLLSSGESKRNVAMVTNVSIDQELNNLENHLEEMITYDFFTINLVTIYRHFECDKHLDYTVLLLYNIINLIPDFQSTYVNLLVQNYFTNESSKYRQFVINLTTMLKTVQNVLNYEKFNYLLIITIKILQYRFRQITDGIELFQYLKEFVKANQQTELYWSILLCPSNHFNEKNTGQISLYNISIDNIYSNTKFKTFYYTLLVYLHTKYMQMASQENGEIHGLLNHDKELEVYNYLDVMQYFTDLHDYIKTTNCSQNLKQRFRTLVKRYFLDANYIKIDRQGQILDVI